jgi:hypothetical protein
MPSLRNGMALAAFTACLLAAADPQWIHTRSPHFTIYSSASPGPTREMLQHFEFVHSFFQQVLGDLPPGGHLLYLVLFGSEKENARHRSHDWAVGAFQEFADHDIIVIGGQSQDLATAVTSTSISGPAGRNCACRYG